MIRVLTDNLDTRIVGNVTMGVSLDNAFTQTKKMSCHLLICLLFQCLWHGCKKCFPCERSGTKTSLTKQSMDELYVVTKKREKTIRELGFGYRKIWEHDFASQLKSNQRLKLFANNLDIEERLDPRLAFFVSI